MKVVVQPTRFQIELGGKWFEASEQEARELWAKLNEHFGAKDATPQRGGITITPGQTFSPSRHPLEQYAQDIQYSAGLDCNAG